MEEILEEVGAIQAIYCGENEFSLCSKGDSSVTFSVTTSPSNDTSLKITVTFVLLDSYPRRLPSISVQSQYLSRQECDKIKTFLSREAETYCGSPMIMSLLTALQEKDVSRRVVSMTTSKPKDEEEITTCVLQLDHMRNKSQYTKTIKRWCEELEITGRLLFCQRWIFIILQSCEINIKSQVSWA
ncbi:RWD domain-containing protein 3-like isoform X3 [Macrobrachium nipponense]|uniref:RWD domain-containing protein 3-like isoform X3 n=1 Tax=Macrobrachium nipponense TaxID=159736 RepID=UPI0030C823DF